MKILCIADTVDPLVDSLGIKERFGDVDLVLSAGDLPMEYLSYIVSMLNKPLLFVFGNHNLTDLPLYRPAAATKQEHERLNMHDFSRFIGATYVGFKVKRESDLIVFGLGGSLKYNNGPNQFSQLQMWIMAFAKVPALLWNKLTRGRAVDIILTHAPPSGIHDKEDKCHRGFKAFLWLMTVFKPRYLVHGHIHLYDAREKRATVFGDTTVLNAYGYQIIDTGDPHA